jgi:hypothetical protein
MHALREVANLLVPTELSNAFKRAAASLPGSVSEVASTSLAVYRMILSTCGHCQSRSITSRQAQPPRAGRWIFDIH